MLGNKKNGIAAFMSAIGLRALAVLLWKTLTWIAVVFIAWSDSISKISFIEFSNRHLDSTDEQKNMTNVFLLVKSLNYDCMQRK